MNTMNQNKSIAAYTLYSIVSRGGKSARMKRSPCENIYIYVHSLTYSLSYSHASMYTAQYNTIHLHRHMHIEIMFKIHESPRSSSYQFQLMGEAVKTRK